LSKRIRRNVRDLETRCDLAHDVQKMALQADTIRGLDAKVRELEAALASVRRKGGREREREDNDEDASLVTLLKHIWEGRKWRRVLSFQTLALLRAIKAAKADKTVWWVADVRTAAAFIESIGGIPDADRPRLMEHAAEGPCVLALVCEGPGLAAGKWYGKAIRHDAERGFFSLTVVVDRQTHARLRGLPPPQWQLASQQE